MKRTWRILGVAIVALSSACGPAFIGAAVANAANKDSGNAPTLVGGLSVDETAEVMHMSSITVIREWNKAKAWLYRELSNN